MGMRKKMKKRMQRYAEETFSGHRESAYAAITAICCCLEFLQNQENQGRWRAIPLKSRIYVLMDRIDFERSGIIPSWNWEEEFRETYAHRLRREEYRKLLETLDDSRQCVTEEIPLKNFLKQGFVWIMEGVTEPSWAERMKMLIQADQYTGVRAFQEAVYVMGFLELQDYESGKKYHIFKGDFRDADRLLQVFRGLIPETEQKNYDHFCTELLQDLEKKRMEAMRQTLEEREEWREEAQRVAGGIPVLDFFNKKMREMEDGAFREFLTERLTVADHIEGNEDDRLKGEELLEKKADKLQALADLFVYGERGIKERLLKNLSREEQLAVMEQWMSNFYPSDTDQLSDRLADMYEACGVGLLWEEEEEKRSYEKMMLESLGKLAGRAVEREEIRYPTQI